MHMANEAIPQASESTQSIRPASRRRSRKVANLRVELAADLDLWPVVEPWERSLILPRLAKWLEDELAGDATQKESGRDE
jgi:hypothetical protein